MTLNEITRLYNDAELEYNRLQREYRALVDASGGKSGQAVRLASARAQTQAQEVTRLYILRQKMQGA